MIRLLVVALLLAAAPVVAQIENPPVTIEDYPNTDGSTSARPIARVLFLEMFGAPWEWQELPAASPYDFSPGQEVVPTDPEGLAPAVAGRYPQIRLHHGTHDAWMRLLRGGSYTDGTSLIFECRLPSEDERLEMARRGVAIDPLVIARDGFVFVVNERCQVDGLTLDQVRRIFLGEITRWSEVGGADEEIMPITRNRNSGSQETMITLVMDGREPLTPAQDLSGLEGMWGPFGFLIDDYDGRMIAFTFHSYWRQQVTNRGTKCLAIDGVAPTVETIASGEYPLTTDVYAVIRADEPEDSPARRLRDWLLTDDGQSVIEHTGYVSLRQAGLLPADQ